MERVIILGYSVIQYRYDNESTIYDGLLMKLRWLRQ
jgi:hypothetical protein